jgi:hypothetical protein
LEIGWWKDFEIAISSPCSRNLRLFIIEIVCERLPRGKNLFRVRCLAQSLPSTTASALARYRNLNVLGIIGVEFTNLALNLSLLSG